MTKMLSFGPHRPISWPPLPPLLPYQQKSGYATARGPPSNFIGYNKLVYWETSINVIFSFEKNNNYNFFLSRKKATQGRHS